MKLQHFSEIDGLVTSLFSRREATALLFLPMLAACASKVGEKSITPQDPMVKLAPLVRKDVVWKTVDFLAFLSEVPAPGLLALKKSLDLVAHDSTEAVLKGRQVDALEISATLCQKASWFRQCSKPADFDYHGLVVDLAASAKVDPGKLKNTSTFDAEKLLMERVYAELEKEFVGKWNKMSVEERKKVVDKVDPNGKLKDHAAVAAMAGGTIIRTFALAIGLTGFAGYIAATTALGAATTAIGVTLPFVAYTSMTTAISVLSGPIGWTAGMVFTIFGVALAGRPDIKTTAAFVLMLHALKTDALRAAGQDSLA